MTHEDRAFLEELRADALAMIGATGLIERDALADGNAKQAWRANKTNVKLLALVDKIGKRLNRADVASDAAELVTGDYDLAALATAAPARLED